MLKLGFIGLGTMGKWMAINLVRGGFSLTVCDLRPEPVAELVGHGAAPAQDPASLAGNVDAVLLSLPETGTVEEVIFGDKGLISSLSPGTIVVDLSTINYLATVEIGERLRARRIIFVDAPVSGMEARAKSGTLTVMAGGEPAAVERIRPVFEKIGNTIVYMGKTGNGQLAKLVNQLFLNISAAALAEILPMAFKLGLDPEDVCSVVKTGTGQTYAFDFFAPLILQNDFKPGYPLINAYKDMISAADISSRQKIPLPVVHAAMQTYQLALAQGLGGENKGAMIKVWEKILGIEVRKKK
jgi:3-hydroxyisobutyrate dehydrogenase-like beta-hydroxyacid dehydrogenase